MNCQGYERWIALLVSDDLSSRRAGKLEKHLAKCARCKTAAAEMSRNRLLLRESKDGLAPAEALARATKRTLAVLNEGLETSSPSHPPPLYRWAIPAAAIFLVAALLSILLLRQREKVLAPPVRQQQAQLLPPKPESPNRSAAGQSITAAPIAPSAAPSALVQKGPPRLLKPRLKAGANPRRDEAEPSPPLLIRLETPDPQVVIYWIVEKSPAPKSEVSNG